MLSNTAQLSPCQVTRHLARVHALHAARADEALVELVVRAQASVPGILSVSSNHYYFEKIKLELEIHES